MLSKSIIRCVFVAVTSVSSTAAAAQDASPPNQPARPGQSDSDRGAQERGSRNRFNFRRVDTSELLCDAIMAQGDGDGDQRLTQDEFTRLADRWFDSLDTIKRNVLSQEEFLRRFETLMMGQQPGPARGGFSFGPNRYLGFFAAIDTDKNASLTRDELKNRFAEWFAAWDVEQRAYLDRDSIVTGLRGSLPPTNMGTGIGRPSQERLPGLPEPPPSPVLEPVDAIKTIQLAGGFHIELAAAEPMIEDPIALSFDEDGRLYVVEMRGFMIDIERREEREPIGRIARLEDTDRDGRFDQSTIFVDQLVLPRAVSAVHGGVLYVSDYKLYFAHDADGDGKADRTELVDPDYGGGNVEHAPNGLMTAMDNWIYNARSQYRYRWFGNVLVKQQTENRGQWGITQDNFGRLFYNVNNSQLLGDYTPPNYMNRNAHHPTSAGLNLFVATDQRVFTIRMNTAVNRGYLPEVLDAAGRLHVFASSCSPVIYRGDNFPADFVGNAFVCDSAANLIKRNLVFDNNLTLTSKFAYEDCEFLAATDERFRPVNMSNGPDGTLWVVDMYRGINQYGMFMTDYLRRETLERGLDKGIHLGRIYRIVSDAKAPAEFPRLSQQSSSELVAQLAHPNGWVRDTAQRLLVQRGDRSVLPELLRLVSHAPDNLARIHALWTLEGLFLELRQPQELAPAADSSREQLTRGVGSPEDSGGTVRLVEVESGLELGAAALPDAVWDACYEAMGDMHPQVQVAAIRVAESLARNSPEDEIFLRQGLAELIEDASPEVLFQVALTAGNLLKPDALPLLVQVASRDSEQLLIREAIMSGLERWEIPFLKALLADPRWAVERPGRGSLLQILATAVMRERHPVNVDELLVLAAGEASDQVAWRRRSLLEGMATNTGRRSAGPIALKTAPRGLEELAKTSDGETQQRVERIKSLLAWPGHQSELIAHRPAGRPLTEAEEELVDQGRVVFRQVCAGCHGANGQGVRPLAAPLVDSDWVLGPEDRLIRVLLHGLTGPVRVDGIVYQPPIVLPEMPAVGTLQDSQIAAVLSYVRRDWGHEADPVSQEQVAEVRRETEGRVLPWTAEELLD